MVSLISLKILVNIFFFFYLVADSFADEERGHVKWQHILQKEHVDVLHGLHLLSFRLETTIQQKVHTAAQLVLRGRQIKCMAIHFQKF